MPATSGKRRSAGDDRAQLGHAPAVHADAFLDDPLAHDLLGERADGVAHLLLTAGEGVAQPGEDLGLGRVVG